MLSPGDDARNGSAWASLFCAVTPVRRAPVDAVQSGAERDSFGRGECGACAASHACGVG
jgi:hypothetical protein